MLLSILFFSSLLVNSLVPWYLWTWAECVSANNSLQVMSSKELSQRLAFAGGVPRCLFGEGKEGHWEGG